ncbi:hypothetical protein [Amphritea balenae]|uniref:Uncharacterized protein n=1 Tax=Amphritea balenae TaxID=452629 RepID=A0A3P1SMD0_9GAMM|nr:hypothetical protein [Amphritea balenae]RRC98267.1 hypothetical protein EHS89_14340 [Amphritea balenae]GGK80499.1 hypothetical protein GCM10007941_33600 [Amphritea balenae]
MAYWSNFERESLFQIVCQNLDGLRACGKEIDLHSPVLTKIHKEFASSEPRNFERDEAAILYQMAKMGFLFHHQYSHKTRKFGVKRVTETEISRLTVNPKFPVIPLDEKQRLLDSFRKYAEEGLCIDEVIRLASSHEYPFSLVKKLAIDSGLLRVAHDGEFKMDFESTDIDQLANKQIPEDEKKDINKAREKLGKLYDSYFKLNPSVTYSNDGTGTGKSYSVIAQYIEKTDPSKIEDGHRNLIFITPLKAQIDIDPGLIEDAQNKKIPILSFLARPDMSGLDFKNWVTGEENNDIFARWIAFFNGKKKGASSIQKLIGSFKYQVNNAQYLKSQIERLEKNGAVEDLKEAKESFKKNANIMVKTLSAVAKEILNIKADKSKRLTSEKIFKEATLKKGKPDNVAAYYAEILDFVLPFERAKYTPCILLATSSKFDYNIHLAVNNDDGEVGITSMPFDYILGQKKRYEEEMLADMNGKAFEQQVDFLKHNYFVLDHDNYFRKHKIDFTLIVDEEHVAYELFFNSCNKQLFDTNFKIDHILSAVYRIVSTIKGTTQSTDEITFYDTKKKFIADLEDTFGSKCNVESDNTLIEILSLFRSSVEHIFIDSSEVEQVIQICKNVFSLTPKRFFNQEALKKIRLRSLYNDTVCQIYYEKEVTDPNPTMYDIMQVIICCFYACSRIKDEHFESMISDGNEYNQNSPLKQFITKAKRSKVSLSSLFDRVDDDSLYIDEFFTYFTPKIVFSIFKVESLPYQAPELKDKIFVNFRLDLFEELPEVTLHRILYGTRNSVICLSATSGFSDIYNGNYARKPMELFGTDTRNNLGYQVESRTSSDIERLVEVRKKRELYRKIEISSFEDSDKDVINSNREDRSFKRIFKALHTPLKKHLASKNKYHLKELARVLESVLLAAYEGKNTLTLSLTNNFSKAFRAYLKTPAAANLAFMNVIDEGSQKVIELTPFKDRSTIRLVLFDAELPKTGKMDKWLEIDSQNLKIAFVSSYKSAGTGLNLFVRYTDTDITEDFERLILANGPFYSAIKTDSGLNSISNYVLLLKHYASSGKLIQLREFDVNLTTGDNYKILMNEHRMAVLSQIMQAVGRVERRDTKLNTEIYLPEDLIEDIAIQFQQLKKPGNELSIESMSLLNHELMAFCMDFIKQRSFEGDEKREQFEAHIRKQARSIDDYFKNDFKTRRLNDARTAADLTAVDLNEAFRSIDCVVDPKAYVKRLLDLPEVQEDNYLRSIINALYIKPEDTEENIVICRTSKGHNHLSDMKGGNVVYRPYESIVPSYHKASRNEDGTALGILGELRVLSNTESQELLPNPAVIPLFKGNVGEYIFQKCLDGLEVKPLTVEESFKQIGSFSYELFDFYIKSEGRMLCIDVKSWSSGFDQEKNSNETFAKSKKKMEQISQVLKPAGITPVFIYVNAHYDENELFIRRENHDGGTQYFLNLFKIVHRYYDKKSRDGQKTKDSVAKQMININRTLKELLKG